MRHAELKAAIEATGLEVRQGEKVQGGVRWYTVGGERHRLEWVGPRTGDGEVDICTTSDGAGGLGFTLRSVKWAARYVNADFFAWEAHFAERHEDLERHEALTS